MRLTLRTLLAYLDDRLSSANAREIGKKLKDSPFAQELAGRIRTVVRQRRLMTPGRKIKMIDPNLIAEYLDDQLTAELVSLIEKEVLASDFSLAEVAASHELLGLLGDPVELDDRLRQRLLRESPHRSPDETTDHEMERGARAPLSESSQQQAEAAQDEWKPLAPQKSFSPKSPALILAALFIAWLAVALTDPATFRSSDERVADVHQDAPDANAAKNGEREVQPNAMAEDVARSDRVDDADHATSEIDDGGSDTSAASGTEFTTPAAPLLPDVTDSAGESGPTVVIATPAPLNEDVAVTAATPTTDESKNGPLTAEPVVPAEPVLPENQATGFAVDDPHGMLLSYDLQVGDWQRATVLRGDALNWHGVLTERISALSRPFSSEIIPDRGSWSAIMLSPCLFRFQDHNGPQLHLYDGRCVVVLNPLAEQTSPAVLTLATGESYVTCSLAGDDLQLGIQVIPTVAVAPVLSEGNGTIDETTEVGVELETALQPDNSAFLPLTGNALVSLFVASGNITIESAEMEPVTIGKGRFVQWMAVEGKLESFTMSEPAQQGAIPDWVHTADQPPVQGVQRAIGKLARAMEDSTAVTETAHEASQQKNPLVASYAASILSVTREVDLLVQLLLQTDEEQVRIEAIHGIRQAAAQTSAGWQATLNALENRLPRRDLEPFVRLMKRLTPDEAKDKTSSLWAVSMLRHERAAIRQLAFMNLVEITGERNGYHPDSDRSAISGATERWERWLKRNGNRLLNAEL